ncbi:MAG TPA: methyltransferase domain-containing protein [Bacteroidales bacterium]|nr:methyltransferase domain-containing protein [Bacteroidales bacterium]
MTNEESKYIWENNEWESPVVWDKIYSDEDDFSYRWSLYRDPRYLLKTIEKLNSEEPLKILDAGCGNSFLPDLAARFGHQVVGVDVSPLAIKTCKSREVREQDLALCFAEQYQKGCFKGEFYYFITDPDDYNKQIFVDYNSEIKKHYKPGGKAEYELCNWNDTSLSERHGTFDIILNQNGLRGASCELISRTFQSFYKLLNPGGILIETIINAYAREATIIQSGTEAGFVLIEQGWMIHDAEKYKTEMNTTQKYMVLCSHSG